MFRSIVLPSIIVCIIALPLIYASAKKNDGPQSYNPSAGYQQRQPNSSFIPNPSQTVAQPNPYRQASAPINVQTAPTGNPIFQSAPYSNNPISNPANPNSLPRLGVPVNGVSTNSAFQTGFPTNPATQPNWGGQAPTQSPVIFGDMTPDFGKTQTFVFPGNAQGPNLNATPLDFIPVTNLAEVIRFNVTPAWIKQRWKRVSTTPDEPGLHGLRVALVTGTNSWDLHGSLTYYFDDRQRVQRVTFRGWTGDPTRLINLLTQSLGFEAQPTHLAGFYLAKLSRKLTGGLLMQNPPVIYTDNPVQQVALVMEINNQQGPFVLSDDFRSLIEGSQRQR